MKNPSIPLEARTHLVITSLGQFFKIITNLSKFCTLSWHCCKLVKMAATLKVLLASIWNLGTPKNCQARNATLRNCFLWSFHHYKGDFRSHLFIPMHLYNDNSVFTKERLVSLVDVPTPHKESSMLHVEKIRLALNLGFRCLDTFIKRGNQNLFIILFYNYCCYISTNIFHDALKAFKTRI